jgi:hypothetical protein
MGPGFESQRDHKKPSNLEGFFHLPPKHTVFNELDLQIIQMNSKKKLYLWLDTAF